MGNKNSRGKIRSTKGKQIVQHGATDRVEFWETRWKQGTTPWDLGTPLPILVNLRQTGQLPKGRVLIPGCGSGYDVTAISCAERYVVGLDFSGSCIKHAMKLHSALPNAKNFEFVQADFFKYIPTQLFDLIFDYTFFCAIDPSMRLAWGQKISQLLTPDGELITLMLFPINPRDDIPPYKVSESDYANVLIPLGFKAVYDEDNALAVGSRKGKEKLVRWKRFKNAHGTRN